MCHSEATVVNGRIHGMVQGWFLNGQMEVQSYAWHGEQHGICKSWFENGVLGKECVYVHDQRCGTYKEWWPTGKPAIVEEYSDDKLHGKQTRWDEKGRKTAEGEWNHGERVGVWTLGLERQGRPDEFYYVTVSMGPWTGGTREQFLVRIGFACRESVFSPREGIFSGLVDSDAFLFEVFGKPNKILPDPKSRNSHIWRYDNCSDGPVFLRSSWYAPKQLFQLWDYTPKSQPEPNPEP
jgi:hypothetical protein